VLLKAETDKLDRTSDTQKRHLLLQHLAHIRASLNAPSGKFLFLLIEETCSLSTLETAMGRILKSALYSDFYMTQGALLFFFYKTKLYMTQPGALPGALFSKKTNC